MQKNDVTSTDGWRDWKFTEEVLQFFLAVKHIFALDGVSVENLIFFFLTDMFVRETNAFEDV